MVFYTLFKAYFAGNIQQIPQQQNLFAFPPSMILHCRNFFFRTVESLDDLDTLLATLSQELKAGVLDNTKTEWFTDEDYITRSKGLESDYVKTENKDIEHKVITNPDVNEEDKDYLEDLGAILGTPSNVIHFPPFPNDSSPTLPFGRLRIALKVPSTTP